MQPGTLHYVLTTSDCLAVGGHFFCGTLFHQTLRSLVTEHHLGFEITNTEHRTSVLVLFKLVSKYASMLLTNYSTNPDPGESSDLDWPLLFTLGSR